MTTQLPTPAVVPTAAKLRDLHQSIHQDVRDRYALFDNKRKVADPKALNCLGIGDSWFNYPDPEGLIPLVNDTGVLSQLEELGSVRPSILNMAHYGDATTQEMGLAKTQKLVSAMQRYSFDVILMSGGGNDIVGDSFILWLNHALSVGGDPRLAVDAERFNDILSVIRASVENLVLLRNMYAPSAPIFLHAYDYAYPSGVGVCMIGPWLRPALRFMGWSDDTQNFNIVKDCLDRLANFYRGMAADPANNIVYVDTHGVLDRGDWANELHPNPAGFKKIANVWATVLRSKFPDRI